MLQHANEGERSEPEDEGTAQGLAHGRRPPRQERAETDRSEHERALIAIHQNTTRRMVGACFSMRTRASEASPRMRERRRAWRMAEGHRDKDAPRPTKQSTHKD